MVVVCADCRHAYSLAGLKVEECRLGMSYSSFTGC